MAPAHLKLFPSPSTSNGPSRRTSLRRLQTDKVPNANGEMQLNGVAFQVVGSPKAQPKVQPAQETFQHSLFCNPTAVEAVSPPTSASTTKSSNGGPLARHTRTRRGSSPIFDSSQTVNLGSPSEEDELSELPQNTHFGNSKPHKKALSSNMDRPSKPGTISVNAPRVMRASELISPIDEKRDAVSPLPDKIRFRSSSPKPEYPSSFDSPAKSPGYHSPMRSIFPRYDPSKPLTHQHYYPTARAPSPSLYSSPISSIESPLSRQELKRYDSAVGLVDRYEHIPAAGHADLETFWKASIEEFPCDGRKVQFPLFQPSECGTSLAIGTSPQDLIYSMERDDSSKGHAKRYTVKKHCPTAPSSTPVAQLALPERSDNIKDLEVTAIFPQGAAFAAIEAVANSPQAAAIATFDPTAESPQAARLAQHAVALAHQDYGCDLMKKTRRRDSTDHVTATYDLKHPLLGVLPVTVTKSQGPISSTGGPKAKISLHHPSATPAAVVADTLNLAFLDFAHNACMLDIPALLALDSHHVLDTVVSTLFAVAAIENDALIKEQITFAPPPKTPIYPANISKKDRQKIERRASTGSTTSKKWFRRAEKKKAKPIIIEEPEQVELPGFGRAVIGLTGMAFKGAFWVLGTGVKVVVRIARS